MYDPLVMRDAKTFEYRPGLATEWKPSNEMRTWTFKLRSGVKFHEVAEKAGKSAQAFYKTIQRMRAMLLDCAEKQMRQEAAT